MPGSPLLMLAMTMGGAPAQEIVAQQRMPIALLLVTPKGNESEAARQNAGLVEWLAEAFERETDLTLERLDLSQAASCEGDLTCLILRARPDYNRLALELPDGTVEPYSKHLEHVRKDRVRYPQYLVLLTSLVQKGQPDRLSIRLVDTDVALSIYHQASRSGEWKSRVDSEIIERAVRVNGKRVDAPTGDAAIKYLDEILRGEMQQILERDGHWRPFGAIVLTLEDDASVALSLDGAAIGTPKRGETRISNVPAGRHSLSLENPSYERFVREVVVERGGEAALTATLVRLPSADHAMARSVVTWTGAGLAALGATVLAISIVNAGNAEVDLLCFNDSDCREPTFYALDGSTDEKLNPDRGSILGAPLGYSLMGAGAAWSLGTLFVGSGEDFPWIQLAAGVAVGAAAYGISAALDPG
ncbi:MAG: PEGA domain-containing protein [Deltaproteobacteria bacterium]|nr:PEGA domain-containing protein [Deltaproteobacteria bacterium]